MKDNGEKFEDLLRERERQNSKFTFLFDTSVSSLIVNFSLQFLICIKTPENRLYRSIIAGESLVYGFDDDVRPLINIIRDGDKHSLGL